MFVALASGLYVIAVAMIYTGISLVMNGAQILTLDRGLAYYVGGMGTATGGAVLFGIATLVLCLGFINRSLKEIRAQAVTPVAAEAIAPVAAVAAPLAAVGAVEKPVDERQRDMFETAAAVQHDGLSPTLATDDINAAMESVRQRNAFSFTPEPAKEPEPELEPEPEALSSVTETAPDRHMSAFGYYSAATSGPSFAENEPVQPLAEEVETQHEHAFSVSSHPVEAISHEPPVAEPEVEAPAFEEPPVTPPVSVVGSYESGGNRYVMYSDGSIDAHLPSGLRTFPSLNDLKQFVSVATAAV